MSVQLEENLLQSAEPQTLLHHDRHEKPTCAVVHACTSQACHQTALANVQLRNGYQLTHLCLA